jgi:hypothetical protein
MAIFKAVSESEGKELKGKPNTDTYTIDGRELVREISYVGCVLELREENGYNDSDFYARVWDHAEGKSKEIMYATTRGWTYANHAVKDATDEVKALYKAEQERLAAERKARHDAELAKMPSKGKTVKVIAGRKLPKGTQGVVFWIGLDSFKEARAARYRTGWECLLGFTYDAEKYRVGIQLANGEKVFVAANQVEIVKE